MANAARQFEIFFEPDADGYHVWCPALRGCHSFGITKREARANIVEAIALWLDGAAQHGDSPLVSERVIIDSVHDEPRS